MSSHGEKPVPAHSAAPAPAAPAPAAAAASHPVLWTVCLLGISLVIAWWFARWYGIGAEEARRHGPLKLAAPAAASIDHKALVADRSPAVLDRGRALYKDKCASCHGPEGDTNPLAMNPPARNFKAEAMKNDLGQGPYAFYVVLDKGYGANMPHFRTVPPADRYAMVHFVRETFMRGNNPAFAEADDAKVVIPAAGVVATGAKTPVKPAAPPPVRPLMAAMAAEAEAQIARVETWLTKAAATPSPALTAVRRLANDKPAAGVRLLAAAEAKDQTALIAILADADLGSPETVLLPGGERDALAKALIAAAVR